MDIDPCEEMVMPDSPDSDTAFPIPSSSIPPTPQLPSTSDAFQFRAARNVSTTQPREHATQSELLPEPELSHIHSQAFSDLRRTVAETGEGFVQRMREFEEHRSRTGPSRTVFEGWEQCLTRNAGAFKRGRKRPSISPVRQETRSPTSKSRAADNDDSDVEILSASALGVPSEWKSFKKRAVSLGGLDSLDQGPVAYPAFGGSEGSISPIDVLSSCVSDVSSEDESDDELLMRSTDVHAHSLGHPRSSATTLTTPSSSFTGAFSSSASSSLMSLPHAPPYPSNPPIVRQSSSASSSMCPSSPRRNRSRRVRRHGSGSTPTPQSSRTERAVAALSLALANGAGSVSDYEALRIAQSALGLEDHHQDAGALWS